MQRCFSTRGRKLLNISFPCIAYNAMVYPAYTLRLSGTLCERVFNLPSRPKGRPGMQPRGRGGGEVR